MPDLTKTTRVYTDQPLGEGISLSLEGDVHHYLRNVMRVAAGQAVRIFNGRDGEFVARLEKIDKRQIETTLENRIREQKHPAHKLHLLFAPIKKERMDWIIEKAVELGATDLHPVLTQNTDMRKINAERIEAQIIEAAEQCERMDIPALHEIEDLRDKLERWPGEIPLLAAIERMGIESVPRGVDYDCGLLVGPSGGFTAEEKQELVSHGYVRPVSLGKNILRTETAAAAALAIITL
ncbi:MAG TPA: 16S rRNA (uracil(1498)-N(3))-methyltransferase [Micavibrio sp.]|nr:16S rRNA (uracil(1498)-N(3))-methyltransferase [Micavibrio sp.]